MANHEMVSPILGGAVVFPVEQHRVSVGMQREEMT